jgi:hypothetical protein
MPQITVNISDEGLKAMNGVVSDAQVWTQDRLDSKVERCMEHAIRENSNLNPAKLNVQEKKDWIKNNTFKTRKQKDIDKEK